MKTKFTLCTSDPILLTPNEELAALALVLTQESGRRILESFTGEELGPTVEVIHNTGKDDPPDLEFRGVGIEITYFPPDQRPKGKVQEKHHGFLNDPPFHETRGVLSKIEELSLEPHFAVPKSFYPEDEVAALEVCAIEMLRKKDVVTNQVLLVDQRQVRWTENPDAALRSAIKRNPPKNVRLIMAVRQEASIQFFPT